MNNYTNPVTVTGNPASFEASGSGKLLSLSVPFSPIQDLHGYSSPWPAGGGKNKFNKDGTDTLNGYVSDKYIVANGVLQDPSVPTDWWVSEYIPVSASTHYIISGLPSTIL